MNKINITLFITVVFSITFSCQLQAQIAAPKTVTLEEQAKPTNPKSKKQLRTIWINSTQNECVAGVMQKKCYGIKKTKKQNNWENLYNDIQGFNFKEGYFYKIRIEIEETNRSEYLDAISDKYTLIKIISKNKDPKYSLKKNNEATLPYEMPTIKTP